MSYRDEILKKIKDQYPYLVKAYAVEKIGLFGSVARQSETAHSDIDLIVKFSQPIGFRFMDFVEYIEKILGRKVDVLTPEGAKNIRVAAVQAEIERDIIYV